MKFSYFYKVLSVHIGRLSEILLCLSNKTVVDLTNSRHLVDVSMVAFQKMKLKKISVMN